MGEIHSARCGEPRVLHTPLLPLADYEGRECEDADGYTGQRRSPPTGVPSDYRRAKEVPYRTGGDDELRQVLAPPQVSVREQDVPVWEHESGLCERVCRTV